MYYVSDSSTMSVGVLAIHGMSFNWFRKKGATTAHKNEILHSSMSNSLKWRYEQKLVIIIDTSCTPRSLLTSLSGQ